MNDPILIWGCGFRTGTTLLQRLLCAVPDTMIWGESNDALRLVAEASARIGQWQDLARQARDDFAQSTTRSWIANIHPLPRQAAEALRGWVQVMYALSPDGVSLARWGLKDLTLEPVHVELLWQAFPRMRVLFTVRHPRPMMASMVGTGWYDGETRSAATTRWAQRVRWVYASADPRLLVVSYERLVSEPARVFAEIAAHLDLPATAPNEEVLESVVRGTEQAPRLDAEAEAALRLPSLVRAMATAGFEVDGLPRALTAGAEDLGNGRGRLSIAFDEPQRILEVYVRKNGTQIFAGSIVGSAVQNPDGTCTYFHAVDGLAAGDALEYRFFVSPSTGSSAFLPGPGQHAWHTWSYQADAVQRRGAGTFLALGGGRVRFSIATAERQGYVELFVRTDGQQILAESITESAASSDDGSVVYASVVDGLSPGDEIEYRFYHYQIGGVGTFAPGPGPDVWTKVVIPSGTP